MAYIGYRRTIQLDFNYDAVKQGVPKVNQQMALLNSEFNKASAQVKATGSALDKLTLQNQKAANQFKLQQDKVANLQKELVKLTTAETKNERAIASKKIELNNAQAQLIKYQTALRSSNNELEKSKTLTGKVKLAMEDFRMGAERAGVDLDGLKTQFAALAAAVTAFTTVTGAAFMDYEGDITLARNLMDESVMSFGELDKGVRKLADDYGMTAAAMAKSAEAALSSNVQTAESLEFLNTAARFAVATTSELTEANDRLLVTTNVATSIMNAYKMSVDDMGGVLDELILTQKLAKVTWEDYNAQIGGLVAIGGQWGVSLEEINASLILQTQCGIDSATALTNTKNILTAIVKPSTQASEKAKELGLNFSMSALESKGFANILMDIVKAANKDSEAITQLFGNVRGLTGITVNATDSGKAYAEVMEKLNNAAGTLDQSFNNVTETTNYKFDAAMARLKNTLVDCGDAISPLIDATASVIDAFSNIPTPIIVATGAIAALVAAVNIGTKVWAAMSAACGTVGLLYTTIATKLGITTAATTANTVANTANATSATAAATGLGATSAAASVASARLGAASATAGTATASLTAVGAGGVTAGTGLMATGTGASMAMGPILLIIAAIAALVVVIALVAGNSKKMKSELAAVGDTAKDVTSQVTQAADSAEKQVRRMQKVANAKTHESTYTTSGMKGSKHTAIVDGFYSDPMDSVRKEDLEYVQKWGTMGIAGGNYVNGYATGTNYVPEDGWYRVNEYGQQERFLRRGTEVRNGAQTRLDAQNNKVDMTETNNLLKQVIHAISSMEHTVTDLPKQQLRFSREGGY